MSKIQNSKLYDLEDRTFKSAKRVRNFVRKVEKTVANFEYIKQAIKSSSSTGANYIEANEALGKKDFLMRIRICRKEAKETRYWLNLLEIKEEDEALLKECKELVQEALELTKIFGSILEKSK